MSYDSMSATKDIFALKIMLGDYEAKRCIEDKITSLNEGLLYERDILRFDLAMRFLHATDMVIFLDTFFGLLVSHVHRPCEIAALG
jgi:hypothetical protein